MDRAGTVQKTFYGTYSAWYFVSLPRFSPQQTAVFPFLVSFIQHILDRDSDGIVSAEEIAHVVQHVLASGSTETEAQAIASDVSLDLL